MESEGVPAEMIDFTLGIYSEPRELEKFNTVNTVVEQVTGIPARTFAYRVAENAERSQP